MLSAIRSAVVASSISSSSSLSKAPHKDVAICSLSTWGLKLNGHCRKQSTTSTSGETNTNSVPRATAESIGRTGKGRPTIDRSKVPILKEEDLEENFISGHGPGGQNVNKAINCAQVRHRPTGIIVKVHQSRSLEKNREIARELITEKLDNLYNGEASVASQKKRLALERSAVRDNQSEKRRTLKEQYKRILSETESNKGKEHL